MQDLEKRLKIETETDYFTCPRECLRLNFNNALEQGFKCPECSLPLTQADNSKKIEYLKKELEYLNADNSVVVEA